MRRSIDEQGTIEIGYAIVDSQQNRGYATAAVEALVARLPEATEVRRFVAHARRGSGRSAGRDGPGTPGLAFMRKRERGVSTSPINGGQE